MEIVKKTEEYQILKKRNGRYGIRRVDRKWVTGDEKVKILVAEGLIKAAPPKQEPEPEEAAAESEEAGAESEEAGAESEEAGAESEEAGAESEEAGAESEEAVGEQEPEPASGPAEEEAAEKEGGE